MRCVFGPFYTHAPEAYGAMSFSFKLSHRHVSLLGIAPVGLAGLDPRGRRAHPWGRGRGGSEACRVGPRSLGSSGSLVAPRNRPHGSLVGLVGAIYLYNYIYVYVILHAIKLAYFHI